MTWLPKKAILPRLPANKFLSALRKLTTGPISFDMTKKTPFCDMQIRWFISHLQTFQYTCTTNLHIVSWCMGIAMLCLGWLSLVVLYQAVSHFLAQRYFYGNVTCKTWRPETTEQAPPTDNHTHTKNQRRGGRREDRYHLAQNTTLSCRLVSQCTGNQEEWLLPKHGDSTHPQHIPKEYTYMCKYTTQKGNDFLSWALRQSHSCPEVPL